jgi:hypothetical protein
MTRASSIVLGVLLVGAAAAAAALLNLLLLGQASSQNDPVGKLTPRTHLPAAPGWTIRPTSGHVEDQGADD